MELNKFKYVSDLGRSYTGNVACWMVASDFISEALANRNTILGYEGRYVSYSKLVNLCDEDIVINISFDITNVIGTTDLIILKENQEIPDDKKERIHWFGGTMTFFSNIVENSIVYKTVAVEIWANIIALYSGDRRNHGKVLSDVYKDDIR